MKLSAVVPTTNKVPQNTLIFLKSFFRNAPQKDLELILVINGGSRENNQMVEKYIKNNNLPVKTIIKPQPLGFAKSANLGLKSSQGELIFLINDDAVIKKDCLQNLVKFYQKNQDKKVYGQALVLKKDRTTIDTSGGEVLPIGKVEMVSKVPKKPKKIQIVSATVAFYPKKLFNEVGYFDEKFGSYLEDVDLSLRANQSDWQGYVVPSALAYHAGQLTTSRKKAYKQWHDFKNWWRIVLKHRRFFKWSKNWHLILIERFKNLSGLIKALISTTPGVRKR